MATRDTKSSNRFSEAGSGEQARVEDAAHVGGMAGAFSRVFTMGPQVIALQQALLAGMVQSQQGEAERLAARHGIDDERVGSALERAARFDQLGAAAVAGGEVAQRLAQTFQQDGIFHGYVMAADGTPAVDHAVRLQMAGEAGARITTPRTATTDDSGYFRIEQGASRDTGRGDAGVWTRWLQALADDVELEAPEPAEPPRAGGSDPQAQAQARPGSSIQVQVLAPDGRVVFEDPIPPDFDSLPSEFRYYTLGSVDDGKGNSARGAGRRG